jgi:ribosome-associated translation inhibitor RaiA
MVHVACRDTDLRVAGKRFFTDILTIDWDLTLEGSAHVAVCRLHTRRGFYRATARAMDARQAMHEAIDKLALQRRKEKRMKSTRRRDQLDRSGFDVSFAGPSDLQTADTRATSRG